MKQLVLLMSVVALAACGGDSSPPDSSTFSGSTATSEVTTTFRPDPPTTTPASLPTATADRAPKQKEGFPESGAPALLENVEVHTDGSADRVVFRFKSEARPSYSVEYIDGPIVASPSGREIEVDGRAHLKVTLTPAAGVDLSGDKAVETFAGADRFRTGTAESVVELAEIEDFESVLSWVVGVKREAPFAVGFIESEFIVEVLNPTSEATATLATPAVDSGRELAIVASLTEQGTCVAVEGHEPETIDCDPVPTEEPLQLRSIAYEDDEFLVGLVGDPAVADIDLIANDGSAVAEEFEQFSLVEVSDTSRAFVAENPPLFYSVAVAYDSEGNEMARRSLK